MPFRQDGMVFMHTNGSIRSMKPGESLLQQAEWLRWCNESEEMQSP